MHNFYYFLLTKGIVEWEVSCTKEWNQQLVHYPHLLLGWVSLWWPYKLDSSSIKFLVLDKSTLDCMWGRPVKTTSYSLIRTFPPPRSIFRVSSVCLSRCEVKGSCNLLKKLFIPIPSTYLHSNLLIDSSLSPYSHFVHRSNTLVSQASTAPLANQPVCTAKRRVGFDALGHHPRTTKKHIPLSTGIKPPGVSMFNPFS